MSEKPPSPRASRLRMLATNLGLSVASLVFLAAVIELGLRLTGFSYVLYPKDIEFGKPDPVLLEAGFLEDEDLFWVTRDYPEKLAKLRDVQPQMIFMGDSCTHLGNYDDELVELVAERRGAQLAVGNLGVAGWSSFQGLRQLQRDVVPLAPQVATIYYGWNDHWIGFGIEDKNVALVKRVFSGPLRRLRLVQLVTKAVVALGARETAYPNRVSLADFEANLSAMVRTARQADIQPVLITAASSHRQGEEPEHLGTRWLRNIDELVPLHQSYVDAVRRVAREEKATLCDTAARFAELPRSEIETAFMEDGIHLTAEGDRRLASMLFDCLSSSGLLDRLTRD